MVNRSKTMKIFTIDNIRAIERLTCESQKISEADLVTRVAEGASAEISRRWRPTRHTVVFVGPGNNGADALATARLLMEQGFRPSIFLFNINGQKINALVRQMRQDLLGEFPEADFTEVIRDFHVPELTGDSLVIDGLFGSGLRAPLEGGFQALVRYINESHATVVSLDLPSGMFPDWNPHTIARNVVHANLTLAVQFPHMSFFFEENAPMVGEWKVIDIGLGREAIHSTHTSFHMVELNEVKGLLKKRQEFCSKASFGSAYLVAGSEGMMGAALLSLMGALRAGAGKVTLRCPQCGVDVAQMRVPEAMCSGDASVSVLADMMPTREYDAYGVGPGIGTSSVTVGAFEKFVKSVSRPMVIDADAINCIAESTQLLNLLPKFSVLTPHAGEFDRLFGQHTSMEQRLLKAMDMSRHYNLFIVLKGRYTALVRPDGKVYFNSSGSPALATPGSGDVLTGVVTALMAQGYKPEVASLLGVYVHGMAGELAAEKFGQYGVLASDVAKAVGMAIKEIMKL